MDAPSGVPGNFFPHLTAMTPWRADCAFMAAMKRLRSMTPWLGAVAAALMLNSCATLGLSLLSSGAGILTGQSVAYTMDGFAYRTFTAPIAEVESATRTALGRMGIRVDASASMDQGKTLRALGFDREIEIELEMVSAKATRMRTVAKQGLFFKDRATATEILIQTEKVLGLG